MPDPKGEPVIITIIVDSYHSHDIETRLSVTVVLLLIKYQSIGIVIGIILWIT